MISVLMTVYNGEKYLNESIESILNQSFTDFEFIIVNDGSTDKSREIIESYKDTRIILINNNTNRGLIESLNIGLNTARGRYIARLDHDDIALPERLSTQYDFMEKNREIDVVGSWTECIDEKGNNLKISRNNTDPLAIKYDFLFNNIMFHSSIFFRSDVVVNNGGYSKEFIHSEDYEMYSRPGKELRCANIPKVLFKLRLHNSSITGSNNTQPTVYKNALNIVFRNINQYIKLSREEFDSVLEIMIIKKPSKNTAIISLIRSIRILNKLTKSFIYKNKISNDKIIIQAYRGRVKMMIQHYIIGKYQKILDIWKINN